MSIPDELLDEIGEFVIEECLTNPEQFQFMIEEIVTETGHEPITAAVMLFTAYSRCISQDQSLKDFLKHWIEDYLNVNQPDE